MSNRTLCVTILAAVMLPTMAAAAVAAAVGVARGVNRLARSSHVKKVRKLIEDQSKRCSAASSSSVRIESV